MVAGLLFKLRRVEQYVGDGRKEGRSGKEPTNFLLLEKLCEFEKKWRERLSHEDMIYYSMSFHEDEVREVLGEESEEFLELAPLWRDVIFEYDVDSACQLLEELRRTRAVKLASS